MWRVTFQIAGRENDWNSFDTRSAANTFYYGLIADDSHNLLDSMAGGVGG